MWIPWMYQSSTKMVVSLRLMQYGIWKHLNDFLHAVWLNLYFEWIFDPSYNTVFGKYQFTEL